MQDTQLFDIGPEWQIQWSYDCSNFGSKGNFSVSTYLADGSLMSIGVNELGSNGSGTAYMHQGGTLYLSINSECDWQMRVVGTASGPQPSFAYPNLLLDAPGSGIQTTQTFTTSGSEWKIAYGYSCAGAGGRGNFIVTVHTPDGGTVPGGVNALGATGGGIEYMHRGGVFYLGINSECAWHVQVFG